MKSNYFHSNSSKAACENISKNNFSVIIDCELKDSPELISKNFNPNEKDRTIHFVRTERKDGLFQKIYSKIFHSGNQKLIKIYQGFKFTTIKEGVKKQFGWINKLPVVNNLDNYHPFKKNKF